MWMEYLTAEEAIARLGVTRQTLYAYVSRGRVRRRARPGSRRSEYALADIEALAAKRRVRNRPVEAAAQALDHGLPVLSTSLCRIEGGRLWYREHDAIELARSCTLEHVAEILWGGPAPASAPITPVKARGTRVSAMQTWLARQADQDLGALDLSPDAVRRTGATILRGLSSIVAGHDRADRGIAERVAHSATVRGRACVTAV